MVFPKIRLFWRVAGKHGGIGIFQEKIFNIYQQLTKSPKIDLTKCFNDQKNSYKK